MLIREATVKDIPAIVKVLKASLGEEDLLLSEETWIFKHERNPFGKSVVLVAEKNGRLGGVRAFMRWRWQEGEKSYSALRAVDTATHPDFQGQGIFKRLTLKAVELAKANGDHLIFNTPNDQSRPGYLKMGWEKVDKLNVGIKLSSSFLFNLKIKNHYEVRIEEATENLQKLCKNWNYLLAETGKIFTPKSPEYLLWRFQRNPLQKYEVLQTKGLYLAGYIKKRNSIREFRVVECIFDDKVINKSTLQKYIKQIEKKFGSHILSFAPQLTPLRGLNGLYGPILTINSLNLTDEETRSFSNIKQWNYALGDLELF